jgi:hypothetical protein
MSKFYRLNDEHVAFNCPGCECGHMIRISGAHPVWNWNGKARFSSSLTAPTYWLG